MSRSAPCQCLLRNGEGLGSALEEFLTGVEGALVLTRAARVGFGDLWQRLCVVGRGCAVFCVRSIRSEAFCCAALGFVVVEQLPGCCGRVDEQPSLSFLGCASSLCWVGNRCLRVSYGSCSLLRDHRTKSQFMQFQRADMPSWGSQNVHCP
eukprot:1293799-Rhodomonas_salina.4